MNGENTWHVSVLGMVVFFVGVFARQYMVVRLYGWRGYLASQRNLTDKYRALAREQDAPSWPVPVSLLCLVSGIVIVFGAIFTSK